MTLWRDSHSWVKRSEKSWSFLLSSQLDQVLMMQCSLRSLSDQQLAPRVKRILLISTDNQLTSLHTRNCRLGTQARGSPDMVKVSPRFCPTWRDQQISVDTIHRVIPQEMVGTSKLDTVITNPSMTQLLTNNKASLNKIPCQLILTQWVKIRFHTQVSTRLTVDSSEVAKLRVVNDAVPNQEIKTSSNLRNQRELIRDTCKILHIWAALTLCLNSMEETEPWQLRQSDWEIHH